MKKFHVLIGAWNCEAYIRACLYSLYHQTHKNWTATVFLDECTDKTEELARQVKDPRIKYQVNTRHHYPMKNYDEYMKNNTFSDNDYIVCLDGDDWFGRVDVLKELDSLYSRNRNIEVVSRSMWSLGWMAEENGEMKPYYNRRQIFDIKKLDCNTFSWKAQLWDTMDENFKLVEGKYPEVAGDVIWTLWLMYVAGPKGYKHFDLKNAYIYNDLNVLSDTHRWTGAKRTSEIVRDKIIANFKTYEKQLQEICRGR